MISLLVLVIVLAGLDRYVKWRIDRRIKQLKIKHKIEEATTVDELLDIKLDLKNKKLMVNEIKESLDKLSHDT